LQINNLVRFAGLVNNAAEKIDLHKAYIHVATFENLPVTLIEGMAHGRPLFAAPIGGIPEMLDNDSIGVTLPLNDAHTAAKLIAKAMNNQEWMRTAGLAARNRFLKEYASDIVAKKLIRFLQCLPAKKSL
jgi:glycosyltransferase involved in cell wall biosynthesis